MVTDFVLPEMTSGGTFWYFVEIEPADAVLVAKSGEYGPRVRQGLQQLRDWKSWVESNRAYVSNAKPNGLGFGDFVGTAYWLIVGRRSAVTPRFNQLRQQTLAGEHIDIMTFDRVLEWYKKRADFWSAHYSAIRALASKTE